MKTCVITGVGGLIGSELLNLIPLDWKVFALYNSKIPLVNNKNIAFIQCNFRDRNYIEQLPEHCDCLIHLAQSNLFRTFPETAEDIFEVNTLSTQQLLTYSLRAGVKHFIYCSTGGLYESTNELLNESDAIDFKAVESNYYYASKYCSELLIKNYSSYFNTVIFRPFFVYGPNQNKDMLIPRIVNSVLKSNVIRLEGKTGILFNPIFSNDAAIAVLKAIEFHKSMTFNLAGPSYSSLSEMIGMVSDYLSLTANIEITDGTAKDFRACTDLIKSNLYVPETKLKEGIERYIQSLKLE